MVGSDTDVLAYTLDQSCRIAGVGKTSIYQAIADGELTARKYGRRTLIMRTDLEAWLRSLPTIEPTEGAAA